MQHGESSCSLTSSFEWSLLPLLRPLCAAHFALQCIQASFLPGKQVLRKPLVLSSELLQTT